MIVQRIKESPVKIELDKKIAQDLANRYYHNELTSKDLKALEDNFKLKSPGDNLNNKLDINRKELKSGIEFSKLELKNFVKDEINTLDKKIDKIENKFNLLYWIFGFNLKFF